MTDQFRPSTSALWRTGSRLTDRESPPVVARWLHGSLGVMGTRAACATCNNLVMSGPWVYSIRRKLGLAVLVGCVTVAASSCWSEPADAPGDEEARVPRDSTGPAISGVSKSLTTPLPVEEREDVPYLASSAAPRHASFPPDSSTPLLGDLPGRAVMVMHESDAVVDFYREYRTFADIDHYFYGVDGRWRSLNMAELGIPEDDFYGADTAVSRLSPNGRYWTFRTRTRVAVLDLTTGALDFESPQGPPWDGRPLWLPTGELMVHQGWPNGKMWQWLLIDHRANRRKVWSGPSLDKVDFATDGTPLRVVGNRGSAAKRIVTYTKSGSVRRVRPIEFELYGTPRVFRGAEMSAYCGIGKPSKHGKGRDRSGSIMVAENRRDPVAMLASDLPYWRVTCLGWADRDTLLIYTPEGVLAWRASNKRFYTITTLSRNASVETAIDAVLGDPTRQTSRG